MNYSIFFVFIDAKHRLLLIILQMSRVIVSIHISKLYLQKEIRLDLVKIKKFYLTKHH